MMLNELSGNDLFCNYYKEWISIYKENAVRQVTLNKYHLALAWIERLAPGMKLSELDRVSYQRILNGYAKEHERQTTMDFHHLLKGAVLDAVDDGLVPRDPTRKAIVKGTRRARRRAAISTSSSCIDCSLASIWGQRSAGSGSSFWLQKLG